MPLPRPPRLRLLQAVHAALDPEGFFRRGARRGDPFCVRMPGVGEIFITGHPDGAKDIFTADPDGFETLARNPIEPLAGAGSLILLSGPRHARERRLLVPPFHGDRMRAYGQIIADAARGELARRPVGASFVAQELTQAITLQVIVRAVFGVEGEAQGEALRVTVTELLEAFGPPLVLVPALRRSLGGRGPWSRFLRAREAFDALLLAEVERRRRQPGQDILSLLVGLRYEDADGGGLSDKDLLDELRTLLVAGHETTATVLAWALYHLHRDPAALARLQAELAPPASPDQLAALPYLGAVASESLRLHPVVPVVLRRLRAPLQLRGVTIPVGGNVAVATSLLHAHQPTWPEPERFQPERFLARKYTPFELAPFGGGHRRCLGAAFAAYELRVALGTLLGEGRFQLEPGRPPRSVLRSVTAAPDRAIRLRRTA